MSFKYLMKERNSMVAIRYLVCFLLGLMIAKYVENVYARLFIFLLVVLACVLSFKEGLDYANKILN